MSRVHPGHYISEIKGSSSIQLEDQVASLALIAIEQSENRLTREIRELGERMDNGFRGINQRLDGLDGRVDVLIEKVDGLTTFQDHIIIIVRDMNNIRQVSDIQQTNKALFMSGQPLRLPPVLHGDLPVSSSSQRFVG